MTVNVQLLLEVADKIEADPERYHQYAWGSLLHYSEEGGYFNSARVLETETTTLCGTAFCIAGWAVTLSGWSFVPGHPTATGWRWGEWRNPDGELIGDTAVARAGSDVLGFGEDADGIPLAHLFDGGWAPREGLTVPDALRAVAGGATYRQVTGPRTEEADWSAAPCGTLEEVLVLVANGVSFGNGGQ